MSVVKQRAAAKVLAQVDDLAKAHRINKGKDPEQLHITWKQAESLRAHYRAQKREQLPCPYTMVGNDFRYNGIKLVSL